MAYTKHSFGGVVDMTGEKGFDEIMAVVTAALAQAGYDPRSQLFGYVQTGDLTYITRRNNARQLVQSVDKEELKKYLHIEIK